MKTTREGIAAAIAATRAVLNRLTPEQIEAVQSRINASLDDWWQAELARVRALRLANASPYVERAAIVAKMAQALRPLREFDELDNPLMRALAYYRAGIRDVKSIEYDATALANERMRRDACER